MLISRCSLSLSLKKKKAYSLPKMKLLMRKSKLSSFLSNFIVSNVYRNLNRVTMGLNTWNGNWKIVHLER